jgi:DNA ligase (NAD+)
MFLYFLIGNNLPFQSQFDGLQTARNWGFKVPKETKLAQNLSEVFEFIDFGTLTDIIFRMKQMEL